RQQRADTRLIHIERQVDGIDAELREGGVPQARAFGVVRRRIADHRADLAFRDGGAGERIGNQPLDSCDQIERRHGAPRVSALSSRTAPEIWQIVGARGQAAFLRANLPSAKTSWVGRPSRTVSSATSRPQSWLT